MEGTERERERLAASPPARPASPSSPHVVVDVVDDEETVTTPAANSAVPRLRPPPPPPTPSPTTKPTSEDSTTPTPPPKSEGKASTTASTPTAVSSVPRLPTPTPTPTGKQTPPPPPPPPPSPRTPTGKPEEKASTTASTPASGSVKPDGKAPPPPPPPNPNPSYNVSTPHPPPPPPPPPPPRTGPTTPTASKVSSSSAGNPVPHTSPTRSDLSEDDDTEFRLRCIALTNQEQAVKEKIKKAKKLRNENEITRQTEEIKLMQWIDELDRREAILATKEQEVRAAQMLDREKKLKSREDALTIPLLEQEGQSKQNKDDAVWDKRQNIMAISLACGLSVLISMQPLLPPDYLKWIVGSFAIVWALATIALPAGLFGTSRFEKDFSRHMSRITFMSFAMFVIYVLYILSQSPAPRSSGLAPSPPPQLLESWVPSMGPNAIFYILLGFATLIGHIVLWILGCVSGGDKDP